MELIGGGREEPTNECLPATLSCGIALHLVEAAINPLGHTPSVFSPAIAG